MKEYFFLIGKDQNGPFTVEQLANKGLTTETLVWTEGMENWQKLKDIPELVQALKPKSVPPPPPIDNEVNIPKTVFFERSKVTNEKTANVSLEKITPSRETLIWLITWCSIHLFALLMSYSQIDIFNRFSNPKSSKFWPFVEFESCSNIFDYKEIPGGGQVGTFAGKNCFFNGLFVDYDWTEFVFYVGGAIIIYFLVILSDKHKVSNSKSK